MINVNYWPHGKGGRGERKSGTNGVQLSIMRGNLARNNPVFVVTKKDIESLMSIAEKLFVLVKKLCEQRIEEYENSASAIAW